jgi:hypothetical protein
MELREYAERVKEEIAKRMPDFDISISENYKANDQMLTGINIKQKDSIIAPCIYIDQCYHDGDTVIECSEKVIEIYNKSSLGFNVDLSQMLEYDKAKENVFVRVVNKERNKEFLSDVPHLDFGDLSIYFNVFIGKSEDQIGSSKVNNNIINNWNVSLLDVYERAIENTKKMYPMKFEPLFNVLNKMMSQKGINETFDEDDASPLYIVTTEDTLNGSFYITDKESLNKIGDEINDNFYILPSSIHELLIVPEHVNSPFNLMACNEEDMIDNLLNMVKEVNRTSVANNEILSDNVYKYDRENERLYDHDGNQIIFY